MKFNKNVSKNEKINEKIDEQVDEILFKLAKKDYEPIPENIHNNILKTIQKLEANTTNSIHAKTPKRFAFNFKERLATLLSTPIKALAVSIVSVLLITTTAVGARNISEKFLNKDTVRLDNIGIANEFIFTDEMEDALVQNVPLNLIKLNDDYYINVHSILLDEINFFTVFELHCKNGVTDDLRFNINDLEITDENGNLLSTSKKKIANNYIKGYNHIYNTENSIKELFFMFGKDNSKIEKLNFNFSKIKIFRHDTQLNPNSNFEDIFITSEQQNINIPITKDNYNTIQEYVWEKENNESKYNIEKAILTKTGLYVKLETPNADIDPLIKSNNDYYNALYNLILKRKTLTNYLVLLSYNINEISANIKLYNNLDKNTYNLIQKN